VQHPGGPLLATCRHVHSAVRAAGLRRRSASVDRPRERRPAVGMERIMPSDDNAVNKKDNDV
jgi:hypothetical protein